MQTLPKVQAPLHRRPRRRGGHREARAPPGEYGPPLHEEKAGQEPVDHLHPLLSPILEETLGVILFQEQILQVAMRDRRLHRGRGESLRKAMGRKNAQGEMEKWRRALSRGGAGKERSSEETARKIFDHHMRFRRVRLLQEPRDELRPPLLPLGLPQAVLPRRSSICALLNNQPMGFYIPEVVIGRREAARGGRAPRPYQ